MNRLRAPDSEIRLSDSVSLTDSVDFSLLESNLGRDVESAIRTGLAGYVVFPDGREPLAIFRETLSASIRDIESHPKGILFQKFLREGPYESGGVIPKQLVPKRLSDDETAAAITFIYSHMVNCFKGGIAELLAVKACVALVRELQRDSEIPTNARLYFGDSVLTPRRDTKGFLKCADQHLLVEERSEDGTISVSILGVTEVKSYVQSQRRIERQLNSHLRRALNGIVVAGKAYKSDEIHIGFGNNCRVLNIAVVPSSWKLSREFHYEQTEKGRLLRVASRLPPRNEDVITRTGKDSWRIELRWSVEALAQAAFEMTFWYMGKVGEVIFSHGSPKEWNDMTPAQAGRNAVKMMLYYAILRCHTVREEQLAVALYNSYSFGYALGMNFRNKNGRREMLWPEDLDEITSFGETKIGCVLQ
jgi:hypothetical protein